MKAIIFAGGTGTRLWPLSRKKSPKQFANYVHEKTMFQLVIDRLVPEFSFDDIYVATGVAYKDDLLRQVPDLKPDHLILEPVMRDVGPAVGLVASIFAKRFPNEPIAILWSDHLVGNEAKFLKMLYAGQSFINKNPQKIIFFGQKPRFASPNLGWIKIESKYSLINSVHAHSFEGWNYRPEQKIARKFFQDKKHVWNSGYFVMNSTYLFDLYKEYAPIMYKQLTQIQNAIDTSDYDKVLSSVYPKIEKIHFDNVILEKIPKSTALVLVDDFGWSDVGAWEQLKEALEDHPEANVTQGNVEFRDTKDSLIYNFEKEKTLFSIDLEDVLIVNTPDVLLVAKKSSGAKIKKLVESLSNTEHEKLT